MFSLSEHRRRHVVCFCIFGLPPFILVVRNTNKRQRPLEFSCFFLFIYCLVVDIGLVTWWNTRLAALYDSTTCVCVIDPAANQLSFSWKFTLPVGKKKRFWRTACPTCSQFCRLRSRFRVVAVVLVSTGSALVNIFRQTGCLPKPKTYFRDLECKFFVVRWRNLKTK